MGTKCLWPMWPNNTRPHYTKQSFCGLPVDRKYPGNNCSAHGKIAYPSEAQRKKDNEGREFTFKSGINFSKVPS